MDYTEKKLRRLNTYEGIIINVGLDRVSLPDNGLGGGLLLSGALAIQ